MEKFPPNVRFKYPWRAYQQRVLDELEMHLEDDHLHVVAPPGSGKTVLGLAAACRLNRPALILAPTLTIRNQWIERFVELYLDGARPDWISSDIRTPKFLTVATYQALHTAYKNLQDENESEGEEEESTTSPDSISTTSLKINICEALNAQGVRTIVVDEAHHLKNEWWKSLTAVKEKLDDVTVVALTATPPYDVSYNEWERYKEFCGPVDAEITVPELILENNLCPHQDYIHFSMPAAMELKPMQEFQRNVVSFFEDVTTIEPDFPNAVSEHPWMTHPENHIQQILEVPDYFSSMMVFLKDLEWEFQADALDVLGVTEDDIPKLDLDWMEILLTGALYSDRDSFESIDPKLKEFQRRLSRIGAIKRRKVSLVSPERIAKALPASLGKLDSIVEIVRHEHRSMGEQLRLVILADFIRKAEMPKFGEDEKPITKLGVVPIFERLRREYSADIQIAILCGSLVVVPASIQTELLATAAQLGVDTNSLNLKSLDYDGNFAEVNATGSTRQMLVAIVTQLFTDGHIQLIVGTKSLLGEGWDAPVVNTLVLATYVGSYVLSNQMRGRAIRTDPSHNDKAANIWHLVCLHPGTENSGADLDTMSRRFRGFVGVSFDDQSIETGIQRLALKPPPYHESQVDALNESMIERAGNRDGLRDKWWNALKGSPDGSAMIEGVQMPPERAPRTLVLRNTQKACGGLAVLTALLATAGWISSFTPIGFPLLLIVLGMGGGFLPKWVMSVWSAARFGLDETSIRRMSFVVLDSLYGLRFIKIQKKELRVVTSNEPDGLHCALAGGTAFEKSLFLDAIEEMVKPVENPRYLIAWRRPQEKRMAYIAVPKLLGQKKEYAEHFQEQWRAHVGGCELVYTRTPEGRQHLVKARMADLSARKSDANVMRAAKWQ